MIEVFLCRVLRLRLALAGIFLAISVAAYSQTQGMTDFGNRREGRNVHLDALNDFTLIGIHKSFELFPRNANLNVRFFIPQSPAGKNIFVQAVELQDSLHYFMEAKNSGQWKDGSWNIFRPWPTKDVIDRLDLQARNMGVLAGYRTGNNRTVYLPVDVYQSEKPLAKTTYTVYFVTGQDLHSLEITVGNARGAPVKVQLPELKCKFNANCILYAAGSTQSFDLDLSLLPEGEYHLNLVGHVPRTSTPTSLDLALYHHP